MNRIIAPEGGERRPVAAERRGHRGITLIELLVVLAAVSILAAIAYPSYVDQVRRARRADAQAVLLQNAQFMERAYTEDGVYPSAVPSGLMYAPIDGSVHHYSVVMAATGVGYFRIEARPQGAQEKDGKMDIDSLGERRRFDPVTRSYVGWEEK